MLKPQIYELLIFEDQSGSSPYLEWLNSLDWKVQERIQSRMSRLRRGQFGDYKPIGGSLYELRFFFGSGYRVYFGEHQGRIILLLNGGDKSSQQRDIKAAKKLWNTYLEDHL